MAVDRNKIYEDLQSMTNDLCLGCESCDGNKCVTHYALNTIEKWSGIQAKGVEGSLDEIPSTDIKFYDTDVALKNIASMLAMCHDCNEDHTDDCIINVVRSCMEVAEFGEIREYPGNALTYIMQLSQKDKSKADDIMAIYHQIKG